MGIFHRRVLLHVLALAPEEPPGGEESLHAHRPSRVNAAGADAHLRAEPHAEAVREPSAGVVEHARGVHPAQELLRRRLVLRDDAVRVRASVGVDVIDRLVERRDDLHRAREAAVLVTKRGAGREAELALRATSAEEFYPGRFERGFDLPLPRAALDVRRVHQQRLESVARRGIIRLGVHREFARHVEIGVLVHEHVAHAVGVPEDGNLGVVLDVGHEIVGAARDDEVDDVVEFEAVGDAFATLDEDDGVARHPEGGETVDDDAVEDGVRARRLLATLEEESVAASNGEGGDLGEGVGAGLEDDEEDAEGRGDLLEDEVLGDLHLAQGAGDGLLHGGDLARALGELGNLAGLHLQAVHQVGLGVRRLGGDDVLLVRAHDVRLVLLEGVRDEAQELRALGARQVLRDVGTREVSRRRRWVRGDATPRRARERTRGAVADARRAGARGAVGVSRMVARSGGARTWS